MPKHWVLFFREQFMDLQQRGAFAANCGPLLEYVTSKQTSENARVANPILAELARKEYDIKFGVWPTDTSWRLAQGLGAALCAVRIPALGGDTS